MKYLNLTLYFFQAILKTRFLLNIKIIFAFIVVQYSCFHCQIKNSFEQYNIPVKIVRPFNNYGLGLDINDKRLIPDIARNILNNENITIFSDGTATRSVCYVADATIGYIKALVIGKSVTSYNIGSDEIEVNVKDLAKRMINISKKIFNYKGEIEFKISSDKEYLTDNPSRRCPNLTKSKKKLYYFLKVTLNQGLEKSLIWYKENFSK